MVVPQASQLSSWKVQEPHQLENTRAASTWAYMCAVHRQQKSAKATCRDPYKQKKIRKKNK
jgi:hypothetical protein